MKTELKQLLGLSLSKEEEEKVKKEFIKAVRKRYGKVMAKGYERFTWEELKDMQFLFF